MLDMWNLTANCMLLILHLGISLTNHKPLQPYFICLNFICSMITITISITITIAITLKTILTTEALIYLLLASFASSLSPKSSQYTISLYEAISQPSLLLTVFTFEIVQISCDWCTRGLNQFASSSTSRWCKGTGVHALFALDLMFYSTARADPFRTCSDQLRLTHWFPQSFRLVEYVMTLQGCRGTSIIDSQFAALLLLLLLQGWPPAIFCRSTRIDSLVGSVDSACRVHRAAARTLGYVHHWLWICCSSCTSSSCSCRSYPFRTFADELWLASWSVQSICLVEYITTLQGRWGTSIIDSQFAAPLLLLLLLFLLHLLLLLQDWPPWIFCRSTPIDSLVGSVGSARRVHWAGARMLGYIHHRLSIRCSSCSSCSCYSSSCSFSSCSSSSCSSRSDPFRTCADQLWLSGWYAQSTCLIKYVKTMQGRWGTSIIDSQFGALLLHLLVLLLVLLLQGWPPSIFCRSSLDDSVLGSINLTRHVHNCSAWTPGYVHYWLTICCSTPPPLLSPPGLTCFELLLINSDWHAGRLSQFVSSSTSRLDKDAGEHPLLALDSLLYSSISSS